VPGILAQISLGRAGAPREIVRGGFFCVRGIELLTGQSIHVDGGGGSEFVLKRQVILHVDALFAISNKRELMGSINRFKHGSLQRMMTYQM